MMKYLFVMAFIFWWLMSVRPAMAASEFVESHQTTYQVDETGMTTVTHKIALKNRVSNVYADKYWLSVGFTKIRNVTVDDGVNKIVPEVTGTQNQTTISFAFVKKIVLKDSVNNFVISYQTPDVVTKNGSVWEINIPKLEVQNDLGNYGVNLIVPSGFGLPAYITPEPDAKTTNTATPGVSNSYTFNMNLSGGKSISAVFGTVQFMNFELKYYLENANPIKSDMEIAVPPDTNYQRVWLRDIEPKPEEMRVDEDGNWLAKYSLNGGEHKRITVKGTVKLSFLPGVSMQTDMELAKYLKATDLWNTSALKIVDLASSLKVPKIIYQYVIGHLTYDYGKINSGNVRLGAEGVLNSPGSSICTDYSDLFVTLSRAAKIPAREVEGYAYTSNDKLRPVSLSKDVLHSWPEYFDAEKQSWIYVDPTWESTTGGIDYFNKIDLNHFAFVIHGAKSYLPLPAGAYRDPSQSTKDVLVEATNTVVFPEPDISIHTDKEVIEVRNAGLTAAYGEVVINSEDAGIIDYKPYVRLVPPLGSSKIDLPIDRNKIRGSKKIRLKISINGRIYDSETEVDGGNDKALKMAEVVFAAVFLATTGFVAGRLLFRKRG